MAEYCYRHKDTETLLHCGQCGKAICHRCMVQHAVGVRCPDCVNIRPIPTFDVTPAYYARAIGAAVGIGLAGLLALVLTSVLLLPLGILGFYLRWLALIGVGYAMGNGIHLAVGGKRGRGLQWVAGIAMVVVFLVASPIVGLSLNGLFGLVALGASVYVAVHQLRI